MNKMSTITREVPVAIFGTLHCPTLHDALCEHHDSSRHEQPCEHHGAGEHGTPIPPVSVSAHDHLPSCCLSSQHATSSSTAEHHAPALHSTPPPPPPLPAPEARHPTPPPPPATAGSCSHAAAAPPPRPTGGRVAADARMAAARRWAAYDTAVHSRAFESLAATAAARQPRCLAGRSSVASCRSAPRWAVDH